MQARQYFTTAPPPMCSPCGTNWNLRVTARAGTSATLKWDWDPRKDYDWRNWYYDEITIKEGSSSGPDVTNRVMRGYSAANPVAKLTRLKQNTTYHVTVTRKLYKFKPDFSPGTITTIGTSTLEFITLSGRRATQPSPHPAPVLGVGVTGGGAVTEGDSAVFTVTASPAPAVDLVASLDVEETHGSGVQLIALAGIQQVTIPAGQASATYTHGTFDDRVDRGGGSLSVRLVAGDGYTVGSAATATVAVTDNDATATPTPEVSISGGSGVTEGGNAVFTLTASPAPASALTVNVNVSQSGDYGAATGSQTVTIGTGGTATLTVATTGDDVDEADGSVTATLATGSGYTVSSSNGAATVSVADDDAPAPTPTPESQQTVDPDPPIEQCAVYLPADAVSVTEVAGWRDAATGNTARLARWNRVLAALDPTQGAGTPMTAAEAQALADRGPVWEARWTPVADTLTAIEQCLAIAAGIDADDPYAALILQIYAWRHDPQHAADPAYTARWDRALLAFGQPVTDTTLTPMTATEAQALADQGSARWAAVAEALQALEAEDADATSTDSASTVVADPYAALIAQMYEWRGDPTRQTARVERWNRALLAFGEAVGDDTLTPMTAAEAQGYADRGWKRWVAVAEALRALEASGQ